MRTGFLILRFAACTLLAALFCVDDRASALAVGSGKSPKPESPRVTVVTDGESHLPASRCRKMIVGPGVNQPDPFPGYRRFVGWECPVRLRDGTMYVSFTAGYWHGWYQTPLPQSWIDRMKDRYGFIMDFEAPTGGRAMISRSDDNGITWSKPETLVDSPYGDDCYPAITELSDGLCHPLDGSRSTGDKKPNSMASRPSTIQPGSPDSPPHPYSSLGWSQEFSTPDHLISVIPRRSADTIG